MEQPPKFRADRGIVVWPGRMAMKDKVFYAQYQYKGGQKRQRHDGIAAHYLVAFPAPDNILTTVSRGCRSWGIRARHFDLGCCRDADQLWDGYIPDEGNCPPAQ